MDTLDQKLVDVFPGKVVRKDLLHRIKKGTNVPTFVLDAECRVIIWNKACERLTGIEAAEVLGTQEHWRGFYDSPRPCLADLVAQCDLKAPPPADLAQWESTKPVGREVW